MDEKAFNALKAAIDQIFDHLVAIVKRLDALEARTNKSGDIGIPISGKESGK